MSDAHLTEPSPTSGTTLPLKVFAVSTASLAVLVVGEFVSRNRQLGGAMRDALGADRDRRAVIARVGTLLHDVVRHHQRAAVRQLDQIARRALLAVADLVADELGAQRARLDVVRCLGLG